MKTSVTFSVILKNILKIIPFLRILLLLFFIASVQTLQSQVTIPAANTNTGSVNDPFGTYWGYERTAMIYTAAQIGTTGTINSVGFYVNSVSSAGEATNVRIYMKTRTTLMTANTTYATEISGATLVYGPTTIPASSFVSGGWITVNLATPFSYTGNNLEIIIETNATGGGNESSGTSKQFRYSSPGSTQYYQYWNADNTAPTGTGTMSANRPNIQLTFATPPCSGQPNAGTATITSATGCASTNFTLNTSGLTSGSGISYLWESSPDNSTWSSTSVTTTSYTTSAASTMYYRLKTTCSGSGLSNYTNVVSYTVNGSPALLTMTDSYGDGWNGGSVTLTSVGGLTFGPYTFSSGYSGTQSLCLPDDCYNVVVVQGSYPSEMTWTITNGATTYSSGNGYSGTLNNAFSTGSATCTVPYKATFTAMNTGSATWCAGEVRNVTVTITNSGSATWTNSTPDINIGCKWNADGDYYVRTDANNLAPGESATYTLTMTAPSTLGSENLTFDLVNEGNFWFANQGNGSVIYTSAAQTISAAPSYATTPSPANSATSVCYSGGGAVSSVSWAAVSGASSYDIYFGAGSLPSSVSANVATAAYSCGTLSPNTTYYWKVVAKNSCGDATGSSTWSFTTGSEPCYCESYGGVYTEGIMRVVFNTIDNNSNSNPAGYSNYTGISTSVSPNSTYQLSVYVHTGGSYTHYQMVWIDWDQDGVFNTTTEQYNLGTAYNVTSGNSSACPYSITVPSGAAVGNTRMRVSSKYYSVATACQTSYDGEVEDYTINVIAPCAVSISSVTDGTGCGTGSVSLSATGSSGTTAINWYTASSGGTSIGLSASGATWTSPSISTTTTYYAAATNGSCESARLPVLATVKPAPTAVSAGDDVTICNGSSTQLTGAPNITPTLTNVLNAINTNSTVLLNSIPNPSGFSMDNGVNSNYISDGCNDMYDSGNYLNTNLASAINYSDNTITANPTAFGAGGQYFTRVIGSNSCGSASTIFYWAADVNGLSSVSITGNNGADGSGTQVLNTFDITANGITYSCFVKRIYGAGDPSINHIFMIPQPNSVSQSMGGSTDDNLHLLSNLSGVTRIYYMLYAGASGTEITVAQAQSIAQTFANTIPNVTFSWSPSTSLNNSNIYNPVATPSSTTTYTMTATTNGCSVSDDVTVTVRPEFTAGEITEPGVTVCFGENPDIIANEVAASGGDNSITYEWRAGGVAIPGANAETYDPASGITSTTTFTRWAHDNTCNTSWAQSTGSYTVTVQTPPQPAGLVSGDYFWTGAISDSWNSNENWLYFNGTSYSVASVIPGANSNVFIQSYSGTCATTNAVTNASSVVYANDVNIASGLTLGGLSNLQVNGDWNNSGTFIANTGTVAFVGNSVQTINPGASSFNNIVLANTAATNSDIVIAGNITINGNLALTSGILNANGHTVNFGSAASVTENSSSSFVHGKMIRTGDTPFKFPTGDVIDRDMDGDEIAETLVVYTPFEVNPESMATVEVEYFYDNTGMPDWWEHGGNMDATLHHVSDREHWIVNSDQSLLNTKIYWVDNGHADGAFCIHGFDDGIPSEFVASDLAVTYWSSTLWRNAVGTVSGNHDNGSITSSYIPFGFKAPTVITFGSKNNLNPLPVELIVYKAECNGESAELYWATASEVNNDYFVLQRSTDAQNFTEIARIIGHGNSNVINYYSYKDTKQESGTVYYRLVQYDYDGASEILGVVQSNCNDNVESVASVEVSPNPFRDYVNIYLNNFNTESKVVYEIVDQYGRVLVSEEIVDTDHKTIYLQNLKPGLYMLRVFDGEKVFVHKIIKN